MEVKNEKRGITGLTYIRKIYVTVDGITVTLMKGRETLVSMVFNMCSLMRWGPFCIFEKVKKIIPESLIFESSFHLAD